MVPGNFVAKPCPDESVPISTVAPTVLDMHAKDLRAAGETETPHLQSGCGGNALLQLKGGARHWPGPRPATNLNDGHVSDEVFEQVAEEFTEEELEILTAAIAAINFWTASTLVPGVPGDYQPPFTKPGKPPGSPAEPPGQ